MQFLQDLYILSEANKSSKAKDLSILPEDIVKEIKKNIRDGATDLEYEWGNALELIHQAFKVAGVERPTPSEREAWKQYEELLQYGVEELADARSNFDSSWRMSSTVFREAMQKRIKVRVYEMGEKFAKGHTVEASNMQEVIDMIQKQAGENNLDMSVEENDPSKCTCSFSYQGIQRPYKVSLQRL